MKYKMIAADCDDTILNSNGEYSQYFKDTVKKYTESGGKFVIATGRMTAGVMRYCYDLGLQGEVIAYQGSVIADIQTGEILDISQIDYLDAYKLACYIEAAGYYYHIYDGDVFLVEKSTDYSKMYAEFCNVTCVELGYSISKYIIENKICPVKMMIITDVDKVKSILLELEKKFTGKFLFNTSKKWLVEIIPIMANKGIAVRKIAEKYNIKREEIICIGDSQNDIPMIQFAGLGAVVENGSDEAKKEADIIAPSNDNDGVAYIINKYGFLE